MSVVRLIVPFVTFLSFACSAPSDATSDAFPDAPFVSVAAQRSSLTIDLKSAPTQPPARGSSTLELAVRDAAGAARDGLTITVTPWMTAHGHGASTKPAVTPLGGGIYRVEPLTLPMPGAWDLRIQMTGDGVDELVTTRVEVQ